ncbi:N-acetyltransferase 8 [Rhineura floridana]|uniref:N-acetyltransferase 8 n=1 Tax=Rhineura floridana TaxID=261503 RepID=UPI002AC86431|nr:N-acetyltransferase 8 [Rhineura floridana]XP_061439591.1 N-acetyltransferase 8 [Rhineura floridana]XP_061439592.1 N-acetyltransferase 8 [Rhineura floridana]XP_061439593.1 N-acetyltransferase 8 [Rhineura floridana]
MGEYCIRRYEDRDYEAVRTMFSQGINEHASAGFRHILARPQTHLLVVGMFLVAYAISASFLFSLGAVSALLVVAWIKMKGVWSEYVQEALAKDLLDIRQTYLEPKDCNFWVVEAGEEAVGIVAAIHPEDPSLRHRALELKRMSVKKGHRGHGISKALTRTVIHFTQERGYKEVVLGTSMVQYAAQRTYEGLGFHRVKEESPTLLTKLLQFYIYYYRYEIGGSH